MADYPITAVDRRTVLSGSAGTGPYAFSFPVLAQTDLAVYKDDTKLTLTTDYTVSIGAAGTGTVTLGVAATGSNNITIVGARAIQRTTDFVTAGDLLASSLNTELDSQTIFAQQTSEDAARAIKAPVTDPTSIDMTLPLKATRATKALGFDSAGDPVVSTLTLAAMEAGPAGAASSATAAAASATASANSATAAASSATSAAADAAIAAGNAGTQSVDRFNGNSSTTAFTMTASPATENNTSVYISGVYQQKDTYSISGTTLTFSTAPPTGTGNIEVMHMSTLPTGVTPTVAATNTGAAGSSASVTASGHALTFNIPRGDTGATGAAGAAGSAATIAVGSVATGAAGSSATVTNSGSSSAATFDFSIPQGAAGTGSGDVDGPSSATDNAVARFDATTGKLLQNSTVTVSDAGAVAAGSLTLTTDLAIADGGTGASSAGAARTAIGVDAAGTDNSTNVTLAGTPDYLTISGQAITRNAIDLTTDVSGTLPVANGGSGATSLTDGGILLGSGTGAITATAVLADGEMIVGDGIGDPVAESGATLRTSIGVGTGDSPQFTAINVGAASDTTIARSGAGDITVEGNAVYRAGGTDVPVADGGTGASTLTDGGILLGSGTGAITAMSVLSDGQMIVGDGTTDPVAESGATLRTSIGVDAAGTDNSTNVTLAGSLDYLTLSGQEITRGAIVLSTDVSGTLPVANGGSGATSLTDGGVLLGSGTGAITPMAVLTDGQMIVGDGTGDPVAESGATLRTSIGVDAAGTDNSTNVTLAGTPDYITISGQEITRGAIVLTTDVSGTLPIANGGTNATSAGAALTALGAAASGANSDITSITGLTTDLTVAQGGTGASSFTDGGILLGSGTGAITATAVLADGEMIVGDGTGDPVLESGATLRTSIGVDAAGTDNSTNVTLAGSLDYLTLSGQELTRGAIVLTTDVSGTLPVANGGSGATSLTDGGLLLGSGTGAITAMAVLTDGQMIVGDGIGDPVAESGATLRTSIGVDAAGTDNSTNVTLAGTPDYITISGQTITRGAVVLTTDISGTLPIANGGTNATSAGAALTSLGAAARGANSDITSITGLTTDLTVAQGGTGASTHTANSVLIGAGTSAITSVAPGTSGNVLTSNGSVWASAAAAGGGGGAWNLLETQNPSNASTVNMVTTIDSTYSRYYIEITDVVPATDGVQFMARISDDGGSTWKSGASDYEYRTTQWDNGADAEIVTRATGDSAFRLTTDTTNKDMGSDGGKGGTFTVSLSNPANTSLQQLVMWQGQWDTPAGSGTANSFGGGNYSTAAAIDGIQFLMSSGNIESGKFSLYGLAM